MMKTVVVAAAIALAAITQQSAAGAAGDPVNGKAVFKKCLACHRIGPGAKTLVGPELNGVVGRKAASIEGYRYSKAMLNSGLTFDEATLLQYLKAPRAIVPATYMAFPGLKTDQDIADVIAYLKTFNADGSPAAPAPTPAAAPAP